jgi:hypothetical protein
MNDSATSESTFAFGLGESVQLKRPNSTQIVRHSNGLNTRECWLGFRTSPPRDVDSAIAQNMQNVAQAAKRSFSKSSSTSPSTLSSCANGHHRGILVVTEFVKRNLTIDGSS